MRSYLETLTSKLVQCLRVDIEAQRQTLELLEAQRLAIQHERLEGVERATGRMVEQMRGMQERDQNRRELMDAFSSEFGMPALELTITELARQLALRPGGVSTKELLEARQELRDVSSEVIRANRRLSALVGMHRRIVTEVIDNLLQSSSSSGKERAQGVLLDTEA